MNRAAFGQRAPLVLYLLKEAAISFMEAGMKRAAVLVAAAASVWLACSDDPVSPSVTDVFTGEAKVVMQLQSNPVLDSFTDEVEFTVQGASYILLYTMSNSGLCNSYGRIEEFGTARMILTPTAADFDGQCDSLRLPKGEFRTVFRGESLLVGPDTVDYVVDVDGRDYYDTLIFEFTLTP